MVSLKEYFHGYEFRRKITHLLVGVLTVIALNLFYEKYVAIFVILGLIVAAIICSIIVKYNILKPLRQYLEFFDKPTDIKRFPGKGAIYYLIGMLTALFLFEKDIASASILILAVGDPISYTIGRYYGKTKLVINEKKLLEGTLAGIFFSTIAASFFVPLPLAFFGASFGMIAEAVELEYLNLDDNLFIPLVSGVVITTINAML